MKKANALSCASTFDRLKMPFTAATSGSTSEVMNPQAKNNVVTEANAPVALLWVGMRLSTELASVIDLRSGGPGGAAGDRKRVVWGKSVSVGVVTGGRRIMTKKKKIQKA